MSLHPRQVDLRPHERATLLALAETAFPAHGRLEGGGPRTVERFETFLGTIPESFTRGLRAAYVAFEASTIPTHGRPFSRLSPAARLAVIERAEGSRSYAVRSFLRVLLSPLKHCHFDRPEMFAHVGCRYELPTVRDEAPRWLARVTDGRDVAEDLELECEVVVVGTGAGGAAAAYELASRGRAVLLLEEGDYHKRSSFRGVASRANHEMYRDHGMMMSLGNVGISVFSGRAVGGSTVINSGTCYRVPDRTLATWGARFGLGADFTPRGLAPYYERVEAMLEVEPARPEYLGAIGPIVARGAGELGWKHGPLVRNAPACDGQGLCCFGCPTGAKRSTDVSYVPEALKRGAELMTAATVETVDVVAGRARGVTARLKGGGRLTVRADAVVLGAGTLYTPLLLRRSHVARCRSLGKNLSLHPASKVFALFDQRVEQWNGIPQGYAVDQFAEEGLMLEGASVPFSVAAMGTPWTGHRFMELMDQFPHLATFGFMIQDESRGEVLRGPSGGPVLRYDMSPRDVALMKRGIEALTELFQAAGARRVLPMLPGHDEVSTRAQLAALRATPLRASDLEVTAYHPLGTCRIGADDDACLTPDHEVRDTRSLFVCDGSAVPSSLGVNPQMTIMAMSLRAAERIDAGLG